MARDNAPGLVRIYIIIALILAFFALTIYLAMDVLSVDDAQPRFDAGSPDRNERPGALIPSEAQPINRRP